MLLRIRREIFRAGEFETHEITGVSFREDICKEYHLDIANTEFYDDTGNLIKEDVFRDYVQVTAVQKPASLTTAAIVVASVAIVASAAVIGYTLYWQKHGNQAKITYSNSLRGAQNPMRAGGPVGILLGNYRVPLDMAGMVYSSVNDNKQYVHELFCAGYRPTASNAYCGVLLRTDASQAGGVPVYGGDGNPHNYKAWIGDTPFGSVAKSIHISASDDKASPHILSFPYYNRRCIEDSLSLKLLNADTSRGGSTENILQYQAPSGCYRIGVCMCAPYGYYELDKHGNQTGSLMNYNIQVREVGTASWTSVYRICQNMNVNEYRRLHYYSLTNLSGFSIEKRYEVRVWMDDGRAWNGNDASHNTTMTVEFIQYDTANIAKYPSDIEYKSPVYNSHLYELVDMKAQATDKLTGYIDQFYVECYLQCRAYHADGTGDQQSHWRVPSSSLSIETRIEMMSNPASVLLYVLTNKNVNPRALTWAEAADKIDWIAFRDWYNFCASKHWTCNAWITDQMMIGKLCDLICSTGRAIFRTLNGKYSVLLACANPVITQMFTPRNAWDMQLNKSFEKPLDAVKVDFVDESTWTEAERTAYVDENNRVIIDEDITDIENQLTVESFAIWGVTRPKQIADLEAYQLLQRRLQVRTYAWKCSLEGLMCAVGDVVYMANDNFLYSLGYGRIKGLKTSGGNVVGVYVDESLGMESGHSYGITVRQNNGTFTTYGIASITADEETFDKGILCTLATPIPSSSAAVEEGNLFMYGDANVAGKKLLITNIQYDSDRNASIEAVDYIPEIFQSLDSDSWVVPDYVSGISKYGSGASFAKGAVPAVINNPPSSVHLTDIDIDGKIQGLRYDIEYALSMSPTDPPSDTPAVFGYSDNDSYGADDPSDAEEFEYGFPDVFDWGTNYNKWYKGLYVWQRLKVTDTAGNVSYTDPVYCKEITESLIAGCLFSIVLTDSDGDGDTHTWEKNLASPQTVPIQFRVMARAYGTTTMFMAALTNLEIIPFKNAVALTPITVPSPSSVTIDTNTGYGIAVYAINLAKNLDYDSLVINAVLTDNYLNEDGNAYTITTRASETMTSVDVTVADPFGGLFPTTKNAVNTLAAADALAQAYFTSAYEGVVEGATYALNCDNIADVNFLALRTYVNGEGWTFLSSNYLSPSRVSGICAKAQKTVLSLIPVGTVEYSDFAYFNTLIVGTITADYIGAKEITLQEGGVIQSSGITEANVQESGYLDKDGFRLEDSGTFRCKSGFLGDVKIAGKSVLEGEIENDAIFSFPAATARTISGTFSPVIKTGTRVSSTRTYYAYGLLNSAVRATAAFGTTDFSGVFLGFVIIDGVTYTGTALSPIRVTYRSVYSSTVACPYISISGNGFSFSYGDTNRRYTFADGDDYTFGTPALNSSACRDALTAISLTAIVSLGGFLSHDILPKSPHIDIIGASGQEYKQVYADRFYGNITGRGSSTLGNLVVSSVEGYDVIPTGLIVICDSRVDRLANVYLRHFLPCNGAALSTEDYPALFSVLQYDCTPLYSDTTTYSAGACVKYAPYGGNYYGYKCLQSCQGRNPHDYDDCWEVGYFAIPNMPALLVQNGIYMISTW